MNRRARLLALVTMAALLLPAGRASAQQPPNALLDAIFPILRGKQNPRPKLESLFRLRSETTTDACGLKRIDLVQSRADEPTTHTFELLGDPLAGSDNQPKTMLISLTRMSVNADGSARAYHPDDPFGRRCEGTEHDPSKEACAIDYLSNAEIHLYEHASRIPQFVSNPAPGPPIPNPAFATAWSSLWSEIISGKNGWADLARIFGDQAPNEKRLYHSSETDRAAVFDSDIIPFKDRMPCQHNHDPHGFFVAATKPHPAPSPKPGEDECRTTAYLDALTVPFFVLPGGVFKELSVGDAAIAFIVIGGIERTVVGIVGDAGPSDQIGEGSVAFIQKIRGTQGVLKTALDTGHLDINLKTQSDVTSLSVLVLGGTRQSLGLDYSPQNIEHVARAALTSWSGARPNRLKACSGEAKPNPHNGTEAN